MSTVSVASKMVALIVCILSLIWSGASGQYKSDNIDMFPDRITQDPTYFIVGSRTVRPGQVYTLSVTILKSFSPITVKACVQRDGVELASASVECRINVQETLSLKVPPTSLHGTYKLRVEGDMHGVLGGSAFLNETILHFSQRSLTIFVQTDKPIYMQGEVVKFRVIPVTTDLKVFPDAVDIYILDPRGTVMRRWLSRQTNIGAVSLEYELSLQPQFGNWTIRVIAQGQTEDKIFFVEEYYQSPFEVNVTLPPFILENENYVTGYVTANYTSGIPVIGNLTIRAFIETLQPLYKAYGRLPETRHFIEYFEGYTPFRFSMHDFRERISHLENSKVTIVASIGDHLLNRVETGFAQSIIFNSNLKLEFLGANPQVFKPPMLFKTYVAISYYDGSPLPHWRLYDQKLEVNTLVRFRSGEKKRLEAQFEQMSTIYPGIWEVTIDLYSQLESIVIVNEVNSMIVEARYVSDSGESAETSLLVYSAHSPTKNHISVTTSTRHAKVGEYIIFHVRADYYVHDFSYVIVAKGIVVVSGVEKMSSSIKTFALTVSADMAPTAAIVVYDIARHGEVVADSLSFPVDGITRNNFTVSLNNRKDKTGETIEVIVEGKPGTYVGLSAIERSLYNMRTGNDMSHDEVLEKLNMFDENMNGTLSHTWHSRMPGSNQFVHFPSASYAMDAAGIFQHCGLVVFSDAKIPKLKDGCNRSIGYTPCMDGSCYHREKRCDGYTDCADGSDESSCAKRDIVNRAEFFRSRTNRIQSMYYNSWLWKDVHIGPLGYYIFSVPVPEVPMTWLLNAFSMSNDRGFGVLSSSLQFANIRPFYMVVEMPSKCVFGEQISIKISIFNYYHVEIEVLVSLANSPDYQFVHAEPFGNGESAEPHTSKGEQQHLVFIKAGKSSLVYMPITATRTGAINVTVMAKTFISKELATRTITVEPTGIPQFRHSSIVLDLTRGAYLIKYMDTNITESPLEGEYFYTLRSNKAHISVSGDVIGAIFPTLPVNASNLLRKPFWCGEQNMFNFAVNLYSYLHMRLNDLYDPEVERKTFHYLNIGYQRQLSYQKEDGSFSPFRWDSPSSVWLTAFCACVFHKAMLQEWENFLYIDPSVVSNAVAWILRHQTPVGAFYETTPYPYDRKMNLTSDRPRDPITYRNISLTAHVLIALEEVSDLGGDLGTQVLLAKRAAQAYLEKMLNIVKDFRDPYDIAIVAYALTVTNSADAEEAFNILDSNMKESGGLRYWSKSLAPSVSMRIENNRPFLLPRMPHMHEAPDVETTAYGLLTHVKRQAVIQKEIVEWLNIQRSTDGGWASTQDTIIVLQALMEYSLNSRTQGVEDVSITVEAPSSPGFSKNLQIDDKNLLVLQKAEIPNAWGPVIIKAQGSGLALVQLSVQYNVDESHLITPPPVPAFNLDIHAVFHGRNNSYVTVTSCQSWSLLSESVCSGMAVLSVGIPTGYIVSQQELHNYVRTHYTRNLREARVQEGEILFYFEFLDLSPVCVMFTVQRWYPVANLTRYLPAKVYDYYAPERYNQTILDMSSLNSLSVCQVCGSYQCPYCPVFSQAGHQLAPTWLLLVMLSVVSIPLWTESAKEPL